MKKKWMIFFLGIVPFIVLTFSFNHLFMQSYIGLLGLTSSFALFILGILFISVFRRGFISLSLNNLNFSDKKGINEIFSMFGSFRIKAGWLGLFFLVISSYFLIISLQASIVPHSFEKVSIVSSLFSANSIIYFLLFISIVFSITSAVVVARMNRTNQNYTFKEYSKEFANKTGILFTFILPVLFILNVFTVDVSVLSFSYFLTSLCILLLMLTISVQFYSNYTNNKFKSTSIVFIFLLLFSFMIYNSQITTENASKKERIKAGIHLDIFS
jgi:hypothetical protein